MHQSWRSTKVYLYLMIHISVYIEIVRRRVYSVLEKSLRGFVLRLRLGSSKVWRSIGCIFSEGFYAKKLPRFPQLCLAREDKFFYSLWETKGASQGKKSDQLWASYERKTGWSRRLPYLESVDSSSLSGTMLCGWEKGKHSGAVDPILWRYDALWSTFF